MRAVGLACAAIGRPAVGPAGALAVKGALSPRRQSQQDRRRRTCPVSTALGRCSSVVDPRRSGTAAAAARVKHRRYRRRKGRAADFALQQWSSSCEYSVSVHRCDRAVTRVNTTLASVYHRFSFINSETFARARFRTVRVDQKTAANGLFENITFFRRISAQTRVVSRRRVYHRYFQRDFLARCRVFL